MAHLEKYTEVDYPKLLMHYERAKYDDGSYHKYRNKDIDLSRTHQNYNVAAFQTLPQSEFMDRRLKQLKIFKRDDVKFMCDWIITLPQGMKDEERKFFDAVFKFLTDKYKKENVISAYVHKDESTPHMHFAFVPVAMDKKKNIEKLCSKDIVSRDDLFAFHEELENYMAGVFGRDVGVRNGATKEGNKSIDELKRGTAVKAVQEKREELAAVEKEIDSLKCGKKIEPVKTKKDVVVITNADLETANNALAKVGLSDKRIREADAEIKKGVEYRVKIGKQWQENSALQREITTLESDKRSLNNEIAKVNRVFNNYPKFWDEFLRLTAELNRIAEIEERIARAAKKAQRQNQNQAEAGD